MDQAAEVFDPSDSRANSLLLRGLRSKVGIFHGPVDRVTPHGKSGRADFFGQTVNRAARLMAAACGGQIVVERSIVDSVVSEWKKRFPPLVADGQLKPSLSTSLSQAACTSSLPTTSSLPLMDKSSSATYFSPSARSSRPLSELPTDVGDGKFPLQPSSPHLSPQLSQSTNLMSPQLSQSPNFLSSAGTVRAGSKSGVRFAR